MWTFVRCILVFVVINPTVFNQAVKVFFLFIFTLDMTPLKNNPPFRSLFTHLYCPTPTGQEENVYAKRNYEKYLSALKSSGLVSVEEKGAGGAGAGATDTPAGAGALSLLGNTATASVLCCTVEMGVFILFCTLNMENRVLMTLVNFGNMVLIFCYLIILGATAAASLEDSSKEVGTQTSGIDKM